ncbi:HEAT repeat domain-containing protein [Bremerella sp.]|uniref:HEAT repeat domain-containing protein n=1 Tax=Bremerella sp. TaxID=2795602 RepID=UPI00391CB5A9
MHDLESSPPRRSFFQLKISSMLFLLLLVGMALGWWSDHARLTQQLTDSEVDREIQEKLLALNKPRKTPRYIPIRSPQYFAAESPEHFIEQTRNHRSTINASYWGDSLRWAKEDFDVIVPMTCLLLTDPNEIVRRNACLVLREQYGKGSDDRMKPHNEQVVSQLRTLLHRDDATGEDARLAIELLTAMGPPAAPAHAELRQIMEDDQHLQAVSATMAMGKILQSDVSPRLVELIEANNPDWERAANSLLEFRTEDEVRDVLKQFYASRQTEAERDEVISAIHHLGR